MRLAGSSCSARRPPEQPLIPGHSFEILPSPVDRRKAGEHTINIIVILLSRFPQSADDGITPSMYFEGVVPLDNSHQELSRFSLGVFDTRL